MYLLADAICHCFLMLVGPLETIAENKKEQKNQQQSAASGC